MRDRNAYYIGIALGLILSFLTYIPPLIFGVVEVFLHWHGGVAYERYDNMLVGGVMRACELMIYGFIIIGALLLLVMML